ncbi:2-C-methyl-D-erythritol 4-phosphate cytidylyltransferase [Rhodopirellula sp. MGV]|uniref:2-C-methyl-D-erythritol 4-phosphate cytidylyltransferase n=1 Tax=Rhodopirellula sp. MGV TaxID=2023130 RepID=UPI000B96552F|nr:2-C-methyl-D-erythritol 4-phosphate cytidylyltransferase [Rhodopirellula sp. MGV]OYP33901.1 2-C-methyl-D-erythritol 4-phosphate cytidylyltransferase [Rhodopirellula sp. MGV]PNY34117.1 2-C-methyl-D-erythritol 4-phosphate cytidylyltransferase [Rhodopirellula baltica]
MTDSSLGVAVVMPAAGSGRRFGSDRNKLFALLDGKPIWERSAERLREHQAVRRIVMPVSADDLSYFRSEVADVVAQLGIEIVLGGAERTDSVGAGLKACEGDDSIDLVAIHDAARPLVTVDELERVFRKASQCGAAILAVPMTATVKQSLDEGESCSTIDRSTLWLAQTPQVFKPEVLRQAYARHRGRPATDDAELVSRIGVDVALVEGSSENIKITHPGDLTIAEAIFNSRKNVTR